MISSSEVLSKRLNSNNDVCVKYTVLESIERSVRLTRGGSFPFSDDMIIR